MNFFIVHMKFFFFFSDQYCLIMPTAQEYTAEDVNALVDTYRNTPWCLENPEKVSLGHVMWLHKHLKKKTPKVAKAIGDLMHLPSVPDNLRLTIKDQFLKFANLKKLPKINYPRIVTLLSTPFVLPNPTSRRPKDSRKREAPVPEPLPENKRTRLDHQACATCTIVKETVRRVTEHSKTLQATKKDLNKSFAEIKKKYQVKFVNQREKRHASIVARLKNDHSSYKVEITELSKEIASLKDKLEASKKNQRLACRERDALRGEVDCLKASVKTLKDQLKDVSLAADDFAAQLQVVPETSAISTKVGKTFSPAIRECVYRALADNVPVKKIGGLMEYTINSLAGKQLSHTPSASTCAHMAYELGLLSSIQLIEFMLSANNICLSWDATSLDGAHVNEIHVSANETHFIVDVRHIPGGRAADYVTHIMDSFSSAADTYIKAFPGKFSKSELLVQLYQRISSTLTDRAPVNHKARVDLESAVNTQLEAVRMSLLELNCNVHPLDTVATSVRKTLKEVETDVGIPKGFLQNESVALNVIITVSKLR